MLLKPFLLASFAILPVFGAPAKTSETAAPVSEWFAVRQPVRTPITSVSGPTATTSILGDTSVEQTQVPTTTLVEIQSLPQLDKPALLLPPHINSTLFTQCTMISPRATCINGDCQHSSTTTQDSEVAPDSEPTTSDAAVPFVPPPFNPGDAFVISRPTPSGWLRDCRIFRIPLLCTNFATPMSTANGAQALPTAEIPNDPSPSTFEA